MKRKYVKMLALLVMATMLLPGCGKADPENVTASTAESISVESTEESSEGDAEASVGNEQENTVPDSSEAEEEEVPILSDAVMETMGCFVGCAITGNDLINKNVMDIVTTHFNAVTLGNELKPDCTFGYSNGHVPGTYEDELNGKTMTVPKPDFSRAEKALDKILDWNEKNPERQIKVRGHVLVWHSQTPEWFFHEDYDKNKPYVDKATMDQRQEWYIKTMLTHFTGEDSKYKDLFYGWDVVNEAVSDGGGYRTDHENASEDLSRDTHGSNSSWWHIYQSNEYIINAFKYANKYAPASLELYYNDYNECVPNKMNSIVDLLTAVKEQEGEPGVGTRIDAMGMQGHYNMADPTMDRIELAIKKYAAVVNNVQITELDLKARDTYDGSDEAKVEEYAKQKSRYTIIYHVLKTSNAVEGINVTGITFWGTADHLSWLQSRSDVGGGNTGNLSQCPLLFDENYKPKPCFYVFAETEKK